MSSTTPPKGNAKSKKNDKKDDKNKKAGSSGNRDKQDDEFEISYDEPKSELSFMKEKLRAMEEKLNKLELSSSAKIEALTKVIESKEQSLSKLNQEVGYLKAELTNLKTTTSFLTNETSDLKKDAEVSNIRCQDDIRFLKEKATDLEDRSRRNNLVFYGIEEKTDPKDPEDCEDILLKEVIIKSGFIKAEDLHESIFDRAHRIGRRNNDGRPRPIIARFTYYKDKEMVLKNCNKLRGSNVNISEDFSKQTLQIRSELVNKSKNVKDQHEYVKSFRLNYRRVSLKYENPDTKAVFFRSFGLQDIRANPNWYLPNFQKRHN